MNTSRTQLAQAKIRILLLFVGAAALAASAETKTWTGTTQSKLNGVTAYYASNAANWDPANAPTNGDDIVFDATGPVSCRWNLDIAPGSWTQSGYGKTVTFETVYNSTGFDCLSITGNVALADGKWTHVGNSGTNPVYRLYVSVGGQLTIGGGACISAYGLGYRNQYMAKGGAYPTGSVGGSHGGWAGGGGNLISKGVVPYGSVIAPETLGGGGGNDYGGGAIRLDVTGPLVLNGLLEANATTNTYYTGAGGSVYVRAKAISGSGAIRADSYATGGAFGSGSGGRIAIVLTGADADFSAFDPVARCSAISYSKTAGNNYYGPSGTIYAETAADTPGAGWLILKGSGQTSSTAYCKGTPPMGYETVSAHYSRISVTNGANIVIPNYGTVDMRGTTVERLDGKTFGFYLAGGGLWQPHDNGDVTYLIATRAGLGGVIADSLVFKSGSSLLLDTADGDDYCGNMTIEAGAVVTADKRLGVHGNLTLAGTLTRSGPFSYDPQALVARVSGDLTVTETGTIDVTGKGYSSGYRPQEQPSWSGGAMSHGGRGYITYYTRTPNSFLPYGSIRSPVSAGGGGQNRAGGGILDLDVGGALTVDGEIVSDTSGTTFYIGSGGSIDICAGSLSGSGTISASGGHPASDYAPSGGGRLAIRLADVDAAFSDFSGELAAHGSHCVGAGKWVGGAGTVWRKTAGQSESEGTLVVGNGKGLVDWAETPVLGAYMDPDDDSFGDILIGSCARLQLENNKTMHVSGVFSNGCEFVAGDGATVKFVGSGTSRIYGNVTFSNLTCNAAGKTLVVSDGATLAIAGVGTFAGTSGMPVTLRGETPGQTWTLNAGSVAMTGVALRDCQSVAPITVVNGTNLGGNSANVTFLDIAPGALITWTGAADVSWANPDNWDLNRTPIATDHITVPATAVRMPVLTTDAEAAKLSVAVGASINLADKTMIVSGDAAIAGGFIANGAALLDVKGNLSITGATTPATATVRLSGMSPQAFTASGASLYALEVLSPSVTFAGDFSAAAMTIGNGTDAFDCAFAADEKLTVNVFTASGAAATTNGALRCATGGGAWKLNVNQATVSGVVVSGSNAAGGVTIIPSNCRDAGGNSNWLFVDTRTHWTGATSTDFSESSNWSDGAPTADKDAVIEGPVQAVVSSAAAVKNLTLASGASMKVAATLTVSGSVTAEGSATLEWNLPGTIGGNLALLDGATLTHAANGSTEANKLSLMIGGNGYVAEGAAVTAEGKGYGERNGGPGATGKGGTASSGASHGGRAYASTTSMTNAAAICYGSILTPTNCGSCGFYAPNTRPGGGAVKLVFAGTLVNDGAVGADAKQHNEYYTGAGGSVFIQAASISGSGSISAVGGGGSGHSFGGGGRVALYLTAAADLSAFTGSVLVHGGKYDASGYTHASPGTFYLETPADHPGAGTLTIANIAGHCTYIDLLNQTELPPTLCDSPTETRDVKVVAKDYATVYLTGDTRIGDIHLLDTTAKLKLNGYTLQVGSFEHAISPDDATCVIPDGGKIVWSKVGLSIIVR